MTDWPSFSTCALVGLLYCDNLTDAGLRELSSCKQLRALDLQGCGKETDAGVTELKKALPDIVSQR